jgi:hypothetical protein
MYLTLALSTPLPLVWNLYSKSSHLVLAAQTRGVILMCALYSAIRIRPFAPRTDVAAAEVRLGTEVEIVAPGRTKLSFVGEELTEVGRLTAQVRRGVR